MLGARRHSPAARPARRKAPARDQAVRRAPTWQLPARATGSGGQPPGLPTGSSARGSLGFLGVLVPIAAPGSGHRARGQGRAHGQRQTRREGKGTHLAPRPEKTPKPNPEPPEQPFRNQRAGPKAVPLGGKQKPRVSSAPGERRNASVTRPGTASGTASAPRRDATAAGGSGRGQGGESWLCPA